MTVLVSVAARVARGALRANAARLMQRMMEQGMPRMMDRCFAMMSAEQRDSMLAECRRELDHLEAKYVRAGSLETTTEHAEVA